MSRYSPYAFEEEMRKGFLTIEGGHRVGMAGKAITEQDRVRNLRYVSSVHIRAAHEVKGCANKVFPYIANQKELCHTMLLFRRRDAVRRRFCGTSSDRSPMGTTM